ncbi:Levanase [Pontiella desulfatans]|uniref:Levanase n=1 Tax=Pontiella desulfatans TaxID=2750659 RepID=A0A6C2TXV5_PONDE|nr:glycoside hydrolase family 32 protein [Pontiella desulfatans]VGO12429.1 Levanase [Pontiella desulfatans]
MRVDDVHASASQLDALILSDEIVGAETIYDEALRPIFHYTVRRGWLNDPCGLVYDSGTYHLGYQHNPYGTDWANMHWGHAVSTNLVHWEERPIWLYPDETGAMWSGSSVKDWNNSAGFGTNALLAFYTAAANRGSNILPRMANRSQFTQCMAYSLDGGMTWTKYENNPVLPNTFGRDERDPKVFWYEPGQKWVMYLWLDLSREMPERGTFGFFESKDLLHWTPTSTFVFPKTIEVPNIFELPLDGDPNNKKWILCAGAGKYFIGHFDGYGFAPESGPFTIRQGNSFAATQTFSGMPDDRRRILIVHGTARYPGMPFNNLINFPMELTLRTTGDGARIHANPVPELALLRETTNTWKRGKIVSGKNIMEGTEGDAFELDCTFRPGNAEKVVFNLRGVKAAYNCADETITCEGLTRPLATIAGKVRLQILVDRGVLEIFGNDGLLCMHIKVEPTAGNRPVKLFALGDGALLESLTMHKLGSAYPEK